MLPLRTEQVPSPTHSCRDEWIDTPAATGHSAPVHGEPIPARLAHRQAALRRLLNQWDPLGVYDDLLDFPPDEYRCMEGQLLLRLESGADESEIGDYLRLELVDHFGLRPDACNRADFARRLVDWFASLPTP